MDPEENQDASSSQEEEQKKKTKYYRHTHEQIQELETAFRVWPHPDEKQRILLSKRLGLESRQIKFWFQNRRTQMKTIHERGDNYVLRNENDKLRYENTSMREALKKAICPSCVGSPTVGEEAYFDEQNLRMENARLREEFNRVSSMASKCLGWSITQLPPIQSTTISSLDLPGAVAENEKPIMAEMARNAVEELIRLVKTDEPLWLKTGRDGREVLNLNIYETMFRRPVDQFMNPDIHNEASRDSGFVICNALVLVNTLMDSNKVVESFPTIISKARTIEVLATGMGGNKSGSLLLMYQELQVLSPLVPTREFYFLRCCEQIDKGSWVIADVSVDISRGNQFDSTSGSRRLPSGCLIQDMSNGCSKVYWVEHIEIEVKAPTNGLYKDLVDSGMAFGAQRWLTTLQRMCHRYACLMLSYPSTRDIPEFFSSLDGMKSTMKLAERMMSNFCTSLSASSGNQWTTLARSDDVVARVTVNKSTAPGQPSGVILSVATSIWLPMSSQRVFSYFKNENTRTQWDVLSNSAGQEIAHISVGPDPGSRISLFRALNGNQANALILQESCTDASGSLVVSSHIDLPALNIIMSGMDPSYVSILPSGFVIMPDGRLSGGASTSSNPMGGDVGSLVTMAFQLLISSLPSSQAAQLNSDTVRMVNNLISTTLQKIRAGLGCMILPEFRAPPSFLSPT